MIRLGPLGDSDARRREHDPDRHRGPRSSSVTSSMRQSKPGQPADLRRAGRDRASTPTQTSIRQRRRDPASRRWPAWAGSDAGDDQLPTDPSQDSVAQRTRESAGARTSSSSMSRRRRTCRTATSASGERSTQFVYAGAPHIEIDSDRRRGGRARREGPLSRRSGSTATAWSTAPARGSKATSGTPARRSFGRWPTAPRWSAASTARSPTTGPRSGCRPRTDTSSRRRTVRTGASATWNPAEHGGQVPRLEVRAAWDEIALRYKLVRVYLDPRFFETEIDELAERYGDTVFLRWATHRLTQMHAAAVRLHTDVVKSGSGFTHDGDPVAKVHVRNARKLPRPAERYVLGKPSQSAEDRRRRDLDPHERSSRRRHRRRSLAETPCPPQGHRHELRGISWLSPTTRTRSPG